MPGARTIVASTERFDMQRNHATGRHFSADETRVGEDGWCKSVEEREGATEAMFNVASFLREGHRTPFGG